jgi:hypothetical protein
VNAKQRRFAEEYSVDHNATAAAIRAGYAEGTARQQGSRLLAKPDVAQRVAKLDDEKNAELGLEAGAVIDEILQTFQEAVKQQPKIWKGKPVTWTDDGGEVHLVTDFRSAALAGRMLELLFKKAGFDVSHTAVDHPGEVVYTLHLDRDLSRESE